MEFVQKAKEEVADKVRKLLTQAEDPAATPEEAQAFSMKAQQLMTRYAIDLAMVVDASDADELVARDWEIAGPYAGQKMSLVNAAALTNDCRCVYTNLPGGRKRIDLVGYARDVDWVRTLSGSLAVQMMGALAAAVREKPAQVHGRTFSVGFVEGFAREVHARLRQARRTAVAEAESSSDRAGTADGAATGPSVALVLVAKSERVEDEFRVRHPYSRTVSRHIRLQSWSGYWPGRDAGRRATLARGAIGGRRTLSA